MSRAAESVDWVTIGQLPPEPERYVETVSGVVMADQGVQGLPSSGVASQLVLLSKASYGKLVGSALTPPRWVATAGV